MKRFLVTATAMVLGTVAAHAQTSAYNFDKDTLGTCPTTLECRVLGRGERARWEVKADRFAPSLPNVFAQTGQAGGGDNFAFVLFKDYGPANGDVTFKFKSTGGSEKPGAGIVWRMQSEDTYYLLYANSKDDLIQLFCVRKGKRKMIDEKQAIVTGSVWHSLKFVFFDTAYMVYVDGNLVMGGKDKSIKGPGKIGIITQSDAITQFDDVVIGADKL